MPDAGVAEPGRIVLEVKARALAPGDAVRGRVTLRLGAPLVAARLVVSLEGRRRSVSGGGPRPLTYRQDLVWRAERMLDGERTFVDGQTWPFELLLPEPDPGGGPPFGQSPFPLSFGVVARLERPWTFSLRAEAPLRVAPRGRKP
ncbi:MAG: hypothetical protein INH41_20080 [Myxococcaceae bacterium]|jgi:hypothetical protein|nr:hypothetical protein [Myxococcaceae bacterium]MCA3014687.1 hypothetical protein [Myxococcaceae bacterium]